MTILYRLERIRDDLAKLSEGNSFCFDRGYEWTLSSEGDYRARIAFHFENEPELGRLLPEIADKLARDQVLADNDDAYLAVRRVIDQFAE